jgi:hypothetical protein
VLQKFDARQIRHLKIGDNEIKRFLFESFDGLRAIFRERYFVTLFAEHDIEELADRFFVVDD